MCVISAGRWAKLGFGRVLCAHVHCSVALGQPAFTVGSSNNHPHSHHVLRKVDPACSARHDPSLSQVSAGLSERRVAQIEHASSSLSRCSQVVISAEIKLGTVLRRLTCRSVV